MNGSFYKLIFFILLFNNWFFGFHLSSKNQLIIGNIKWSLKTIDSVSGEKDFKLQINNYYKKAHKYFKENDFTNALKYYLKIDSLSAKQHIINETTVHALRDRASIMKLYYTDDAMDQALTLAKEALQQAKKTGNKSLIADVKLLLSEILFYVDQPEKALKYLKEIEEFFKKNKDPVKMARVYLLNMSYYKSGRNDLVKTDSVLRAGIVYLSDKNVPKNLADMHLFYGKLWNKKGHYTKAIKHFLIADSLYFHSHQKPDLHYIYLLEGLSQAYEQNGKKRKALDFLKKAYKTRKEYYKEQNWDISRKLEAKYENIQKQFLLQKTQAKNLKLEHQKYKQRLLWSSISFVFLLVGLFYYFQHYRRKQVIVKLKELDKAKSDFIANITHEFRTPLMLILGPLHKRLMNGNLKEEDRKELEMMQRNSRRLLYLVDQLLDMSKIEAGNLQIQVKKEKLVPFLGTLTDGFTYCTQQKQIQYVVNHKASNEATYFDKEIVEKIMLNLISNALKYTPEKGFIDCQTYIKDSKLYIEVKNSGKGLSKEALSKIFIRFYQNETHSEGVGIGLALVKELVKMHKGTITVESIPDKYTLFKVILPVDKNSFEEASISDSSSDKLIEEIKIQKIEKPDDFVNDEVDKENTSEETPVILIVDDNEDVRTYLSDLFKDSYEILVAKNGEEGINLALERIPDIIICDVMMPVKNGIELCNTLKTDERTSHIPIILLTAKTGNENLMEGLKTGADDYIIKPFHQDLLQLRVKKIIENRKKLQQRYSQEVILKPQDIAITPIDVQFLERVQKVLDNKLIESSFNMEEFSKAVGISRMQLHRKLKALTGLSASSFIRSQRLKLAAQLLQQSDINISQVGYSVGFNNPNYFSKCFKDLYHCTPSEYALKHKKSIQEK